MKIEKEYAGKGIHFVTAYTQFHSLETIEKYVKDIGITFPVALDGFDDSRFLNRTLCHVWVMGADGKVAYDGQRWEEAALKELKKVKFSRLAKTQVHKDVIPAATAFGAGKYADAWKLATAISDGDGSDEAIDDADYILERIEDMADMLETRVMVHEIHNRYAAAVACLSELDSSFGGIEDRPDYKTDMKRIKALKDYEPELKARRAYINARNAGWVNFERTGNDQTKLMKAAEASAKLLREFIKEHPKSAIAEEAKAEATNYEAWVEDLKAASKPDPEKK
ncbi:MAG: thioredoxin domain-containing protein [Planctomycetota bacterium]